MPQVRCRNGTIVEYKSVPCPKKYPTLTYDIEAALYCGDIEEGWTVRQVGETYTEGKNLQYTDYAARKVLRYLETNGVPLPESIKKEIHNGRRLGPRT